LGLKWWWVLALSLLCGLLGGTRSEAWALPQQGSPPAVSDTPDKQSAQAAPAPEKTGQEQPASAPFWSYAMWPALAADGRTIGIIIQVTETKPAHERAVAMNQALMLSSVHQHELTEAAETLNANLQTEITERKHVEEALQDVIVRFDRDMRYTYVNARVEKETGLQQETMVGKTPGELRLPTPVVDIVTRAVRSVFETGRPYVTELSYPSPGGVTNWEASFIPEFGENGAVQSVLNIARDITDKKRLEKTAQTYAEEVQALAASLLTAQEEERRRVSRELHDQICQQLAALAMDIGTLATRPPPREEARRRLKAIQARVVKVAEEAVHLAYQMHPSVLDELGLVVSLRDLCRQFSERYPDIALDFEDGGLPVSLPREVASCLYRVAQEGLQNIAKHSSAKHVSVALGFEKGAVVLTIADDGAGFDLKAARGRGGLGLIGMEERLRLVKGKLTITTQPGHGTQIAVEVPLPDDGIPSTIPANDGSRKARLREVS